MANVLPEIDRKRVIREYILRLTLVLSSVILLSGVMSCVALLPAAAYVFVHQSSIRIPVESTPLSQEQITQDRIDAQKTESLLRVLYPVMTATSSPVAVVRSVLAKRPTGVTITSFSFAADSKMLTVSGQADGRDAVNTFRGALQSDPRFTNVVIPVNVLAGAGQNGRFSLTLTGAF